jgi:hypothetical protein
MSKYLWQSTAQQERSSMGYSDSMRLTIKKDKMLNSLRAKAWIAVLGHHKDQVWTYPEKYLPILSLDSMRLMVSMAV